MLIICFLANYNIAHYGNFKKHVKRDYNGAENCYKKALKANPKHPDALGNYAVLLHGTLQRYDDAEKYYQKAIEADESHVNNIGNFVSILFIFITIYSNSFTKQIIKKLTITLYTYKHRHYF